MEYFTHRPSLCMVIKLTVLIVWTLHFLILFQCMFSLWGLTALLDTTPQRTRCSTRHPHIHAHLISGGRGGGNFFVNYFQLASENFSVMT